MNATSAKAKTLFVAALKLAPDQWDGYLADACGADDELRSRVRDLLHANAEAGSFLETPASFPDATFHGPVHDGPGTIIGPYKLLEQIGEGGFGLVFMAEQQRPVRRKVAVKVLKPGMDTRQVIAHFEAERQALALMDHPHIARVIDAGETAAGRPYFTMELVRGVPITDYCDKNALTPRQRLELFLTVCQAVQHAHQKGIIHRDIKPSNILITLHDGTPVAKVIDFGIAKALGQQLTEKTLYTGFAQLIGTPMYMSPEQAEMSGLDVDTRSDVYSLGVLLYELMTGTTPFDKERLRNSGYEELLRIIREEEAAKPSTRLSTMGEAATVVSKRRQSDPKRLSQLFRGELDWIVMKALEKERGRRYETAAAFAADVERYLRDEPVTACPPSAWYRFGKLARRNRWTLVTAALVSLALVIGTVVSVWQAVRATEAMIDQRETATGLAQANQRLRREEQATQRELVRAQKAEEQATRELFEALLTEARANRLSRRIGQRFGTLGTLRKATAIARQLGLPDERFLELRNEAIAAMALSDMKVAQEWPLAPDVHVNFDASLELIACADPQGTVQVRRIGEEREIYSLTGVAPGGGVWPILSPDGRHVAVFSPDRERVTVWRLAGAKPVGVLDEPGLGAFCFNPDGRQIALQLKDGAIAIYDLATNEKTRRLPKVSCAWHIAWEPGGRRLAIACQSNAQVLDLATGEILWRNDVAVNTCRLVKWHPDGTTLAVEDDETISLWDMSNYEQTGKLEGFSGKGMNFAFDPSGSMLASHGWGGILRLWDPLSNRQRFSTSFRSVAIQFSGDGRFLAASRNDANLQTWEIASGLEYRTLVASPLKGKRPYGCVAISPSGRFLASGAVGGFALWDLPTGKELTFQEGPPFNFVTYENGVPRQDVEQGQEEMLLVMQIDGLSRRPIRAEPASGAVFIEPVQKLPVPGVPYHVVQSRDGRVLVVPQKRGALVWHADQPDKLIRLEGHEDVRHAAVSPDGRWVATGRFSYPGGIKIWERKASVEGLTYQFVKDLPSYGLPLPLFHPDGKHLLTTSLVTKLPIRRWELENLCEIPFPVPIEGQSAAFSPDGKLVVLETGSGIARLIDADSGSEYARLEDPEQHCTNHFAFTPDGTKLACATSDGYCVHVWDLQAIRRQLAEMGLDWEERRKDEGGTMKDEG
jgi:serine/threonine protein kinase/WD40 repeat protein